MWADAVFEGGGVNGIGLLGALFAAEEKGFRWKNVAGTSAGAIIATLVAAGYSAAEIHDLILDKKFSEMIVPTWYQKIPYLGTVARLLLRNGVYSGQPLEKWLEELLRLKGIHTFADFSSGTKLHIVASDITRGRLLVLPNDLKEYGIHPDKISVARVVTMSCAIPFLFEPVKLTHSPTGNPCYIVDGAVLSNFPIWLFDKKNPRWPTLGFRSYCNDTSRFQKISGLFSMCYFLFLTMMEAHDRRHILEQDQVRTIQVPTMVRGTDFSVSRETREKIFQSGKKAAEAFFDTWTMSAYLAVRGNNTRVSYTIKSKKSKPLEERNDSVKSG